MEQAEQGQAELDDRSDETRSDNRPAYYSRGNIVDGTGSFVVFLLVAEL